MALLFRGHSVLSGETGRAGPPLRWGAGVPVFGSTGWG